MHLTPTASDRFLQRYAAQAFAAEAVHEALGGVITAQSFGAPDAAPSRPTAVDQRAVQHSLRTVDVKAAPDKKLQARREAILAAGRAVAALPLLDTRSPAQIADDLNAA